MRLNKGSSIHNVVDVKIEMSLGQWGLEPLSYNLSHSMSTSSREAATGVVKLSAVHWRHRPKTTDEPAFHFS